MKRQTIKSLTEEIERLKRLEQQEREKRYALESKTEKQAEECRELQQKLDCAENGIEHWKAQLYKSQGHITGMRETLLAAGLVKNVEIPLLQYDRVEPRDPMHLWPEFAPRHGR